MCGPGPWGLIRGRTDGAVRHPSKSVSASVRRRARSRLRRQRLASASPWLPGGQDGRRDAGTDRPERRSRPRAAVAFHVCAPTAASSRLIPRAPVRPPHPRHLGGPPCARRASRRDRRGPATFQAEWRRVPAVPRRPSMPPPGRSSGVASRNTTARTTRGPAGCPPAGPSPRGRTKREQCGQVVVETRHRARRRTAAVVIGGACSVSGWAPSGVYTSITARRSVRAQSVACRVGAGRIRTAPRGVNWPTPAGGGD